MTGVQTCALPIYHRDLTALLGRVLVKGLFGDGVGAGGEVVHLDFPGAGGVNRPIDAVTADGERDARHIAVLGGLDDLHAAQADLDVQIALDGVSDGLGVGHKVLHCSVRPGVAVRPGDDAPALGVDFAGGDGNRAVRGGVGADGELVSADRTVDAGSVRRKGVKGQDVIGVGEGGAVPGAVPFQLNFLRPVGAAGEKAGQQGVVLDVVGNAVVVLLLKNNLEKRCRKW